MIGAFLILLVCQVLGELAARLLGLPVPGPVIGTVLLLTVFLARGGPPEPVRDARTDGPPHGRRAGHVGLRARHRAYHLHDLAPYTETRDDE